MISRSDGWRIGIWGVESLHACHIATRKQSQPPNEQITSIHTQVRSILFQLVLIDSLGWTPHQVITSLGHSPKRLIFAARSVLTPNFSSLGQDHKQQIRCVTTWHHPRRSLTQRPPFQQQLRRRHHRRCSLPHPFRSDRTMRRLGDASSVRKSSVSRFSHSKRRAASAGTRRTFAEIAGSNGLTTKSALSLGIKCLAASARTSLARTR